MDTLKYLCVQYIEQSWACDTFNVATKDNATMRYDNTSNIKE